MSKRVFIQATTVGRDINALDIFHTAVTASNLIESNVSKADLISGRYYIVDDNINTFIASCNDAGECQAETGSVTFSTFSPSIRRFDVTSTDAEATVAITYPISAGPTTGSLEQIVDFRTYASFVIQADPSPAYPRLSAFTGWYDKASAPHTLISNDNPLTIAESTFTGSRGDNFFAVFS
jgi:hypothetical protein